MITVASEGLLQTKVGTEHIITTVHSPGVFIWSVDARSMIAGDVIFLRIKESIRAGTALQNLFTATYANSQSEPIIQSLPIVQAYSASQFTIECGSSGAASSGTGSNGPILNWRVDNIN